MIFAEDEDGELYPVTREELVRVWVWQQGKLHSSLVVEAHAGQVVEEKRAEGWHAWTTEPIMMRAD